MRILVTTSRMPFALDEIRKLGRLGHEVHASDTFASSPGNHSRYAAYAHVTPSPRYETVEFLAAVRDLVHRYEIDSILPAFEEALFLVQDAASHHARVVAPKFETLRALHGKVAFLEIAGKLGLPVPRSTVAHCRAELVEAIGLYDGYIARPSFSRGGVEILTNRGPRAGHELDAEPTPERPWIVQEYVAGIDCCTFSIVRDGKITGHSTYVHPRAIEHAGGIVFESVDEPETLALAQAVAEATGYEGQLSFDLRKTDRGMVLLECNPRPTAGVCLWTTEEFGAALFGRVPREPFVVPAGRRRKQTLALLRDMVVHPRDAAEDWEHLISPANDVYADPRDLAPAFYQFLTYGLVSKYRRKRARSRNRNTDVIAAYTFDVCYDG
jgi:predicted ATP-grasp superfamily ATP-dependent carboligase